MINVEQYLKEHRIEFVNHEHPAVFTCEEADKLESQIPGIPGKNLFLKNKKKTRFFLFSIPAAKRADLKQISKLVGEPKLSFGRPEQLMDKLGLEPGSVSPFGLLNDQGCEVEVYIDKEIHDADIVNFHPNRNTASLELTQDMFHKYLDSLPHQINIVEL